MKTYDAQRLCFIPDMLRHAIIGTGRQPTKATMHPAQVCAIESLGLTISERIYGHFIGGFPIEERLDVPNDRIVFSDGSGDFAEISNLAVPKGYED